MRSPPRPRISLLVTLALATAGASCKSGTGAPPDSSGGAGGGAGGNDADAAGGAGGRVVAENAADAGPVDLGGFDTPRDSANPDGGGSVDGGATNPARLWLTGPESDIHLSDLEPLTPF
jgi:hypothetical protein